MSGSIAERIDAGWQAARYWETECETARAERDALAAQLAALKKRVADAERGIVEHYQDHHGDHVPCVVCDYPAGAKVALLRLEDGE